MTDKPRGLAALKLRDPEAFNAIVRKGGQQSPANFKNRTKAERQEFGRKGGRVKKSGVIK